VHVFVCVRVCVREVDEQNVRARLKGDAGGGAVEDTCAENSYLVHNFVGTILVVLSYQWTWRTLSLSHEKLAMLDGAMLLHERSWASGDGVSI
jgi:hypothetical protein